MRVPVVMATVKPVVIMVMVMPVMVMAVMMSVVMIVMMMMMMVVVIMVMMIVIMPVVMLMACGGLQLARHRVTVQRREDEAMHAAEVLVAARAVAVAPARTVFRRAANALDMVVMARLRQAYLGLEAKHLFAVFAHLAVHQGPAFDDLADTLI